MKSLHKLLSFFILLAIVVPVQAALPEFKDLVKKEKTIEVFKR